MRVERPRRAGSLVLVVLTAALVLATLAPPVAADVLGYGGEPTGANWYRDQTLLTPSLVSSGTFGRMWTADVTGQVYAQPVVHEDTVIVVTEQNRIYGLDQLTGATKWMRNLGPAWNPYDVVCGDLVPYVGVTGTPVIDPATHTAYFFSKTYANGSPGPAAWYAHAVDVATGVERSGFPVLIQGTASNDPARTFNPTTQLQRPGLLLMNGVVYAGFGGHCDVPPYSGWIIGVSTAGAMTTRWVAEAGQPGSPGAGIWQSGASLVSDAPGTFLLSTGNGDIPSSARPGSQPPNQLGHAVARLNVQPNGSLQASDFFIPYDAPYLNGWDGDLGSGAPMFLPPGFGTPSHPNLVLQGGKEGYLYVLDAQDLGGYQQGPGGSDKVVGRIGPVGANFGRPAAWTGNGGMVYMTTTSAGAAAPYGTLLALQRGVSGDGTPTFTIVGSAPDQYGFGSGSPVITSSGNDPSTALVWTIWSADGTGANAQLRAYDPIPLNGQMHLRYSAPIGQSTKFSVPTVDDHRVIVGTKDGHVISFGSPATAPLTGPSVSFPTTTVGQSAIATATLTAAADIDVTSVTSSNPLFTVAAPTPPLPAHLSFGQTITIPVTYTPDDAVSHAATLHVTTTAGDVDIGLSGSGQTSTASLVAVPSTISFGGTGVNGTPITSGITLRNAGAQPLTFTGVTAPAAPFSATGLPSVGSTLAPGATVTVPVAFAPTAAGLFVGELDVTSTGGDIEVPMSGSASTAPHLQVTPSIVNFGNVIIGKSETVVFEVRNTGGSTMVLTRSKPPVGGPFTALTGLPEGTTIPPGGFVNVTLQFTPLDLGPVVGTWSLNGNTDNGLIDVPILGSGISLPVTGDPHVPIGSFDRASLAAGELEVVGWALDPDTSSSIDVRVVVDGVVVVTAETAKPRWDVRAAFPGYGDRHGFAIKTPVTQARHEVCIYAVNVDQGVDNPLLGCKSVGFDTNNPFGAFDGTTGGPGSIGLRGWALDPDSTQPIEVHAYVDGAGYVLRADGERPDVGGDYPGYGNGHGLAATVPASPGMHTVCLFAINTGAGDANTGLGCREAGVPSGAPIGSLDEVTTGLGRVDVRGWTVDPDTADPTEVHVYVDGAGYVLRADGARPDVGAAYPGFGTGHGFASTVPATPGRHRVCAFAINRGPAADNTALGCRDVVVPTGNPFGALDQVTITGNQVRVRGWAIDPDTAAQPIEVHVYVDRAGYVLRADGERPDVGNAFAGAGNAHGYDGTVDAGPGSHALCVFAINAGAGDTNTVLGCANFSA